VIKAVGVSGSPGKDDDCGQAGIDKVKALLQQRAFCSPVLDESRGARHGSQKKPRRSPGAQVLSRDLFEAATTTLGNEQASLCTPVRRRH